MKSSILTASLVTEYDVNRDSIPARREMSKNLRPIQLFPSAFVLILQFFTFAGGQSMETTFRIDPNAPNFVKADGQMLRDIPLSIFHNFTFLLEYGEIRGLGGRYSVIDLGDSNGTSLAFKKISPGVFDAERYPWKWSYTIDLTPLKDAAAMAHVSSISGNRGILMPADLLPNERGLEARFKIQLPPGWRLHTTESEIAPGEFNIPNIDKAVFFIGPDWRTKDFSSNSAQIRLAVDGDWLFTGDEAGILVTEVFENYATIFESSPRKKYQIGLVKSPVGTPSGTWEADTRGSTVTIASSDMPFKTQSLQRLHEQLRHEIFHLWIPNGVNLTGSYDWFYEGFALYQSLKMGVAVNRIRFDDYLDTLSRGYAIDARQSVRTSMTEASRNRWNGSNTDVYARGMLVAFLCDVAMLDASKGKRSTTDLLREIYSKHGGNAKPEDGNAAILAIMKRYPELTPIAERYVTGAEQLAWGELIRAAGIEAKDGTNRLSVSAKLSGRQKDILDKLGYNIWRKLANAK